MLGQTLSLLVTDLLLPELCLIVALLPNSIQAVLHVLLLASDFLNSLQFLVSEVLVADMDLLLLALPALLQSLAISFSLLLALLLLALLLQHLVVVALLQVLQLSRLFASLLDLLDSSDLLVLKHPDSVTKLLDISLQLESDRPGLVVGQVLALDVDHDVWAEGATLVRAS